MEPGKVTWQSLCEKAHALFPHDFTIFWLTFSQTCLAIALPKSDIIYDSPFKTLSLDKHFHLIDRLSIYVVIQIGYPCTYGSYMMAQVLPSVGKF